MINIIATLMAMAFIFLLTLTVCFYPWEGPCTGRKVKPVVKTEGCLDVDSIAYVVALGLSRLPACEHRTAVFLGVFDKEFKRSCPGFDTRKFQSKIVDDEQYMRKHGELYE